MRITIRCVLFCCAPCEIAWVRVLPIAVEMTNHRAAKRHYTVKPNRDQHMHALARSLATNRHACRRIAVIVGLDKHQAKHAAVAWIASIDATCLCDVVAVLGELVAIHC